MGKPGREENRDEKSRAANTKRQMKTTVLGKQDQNQSTHLLFQNVFGIAVERGRILRSGNLGGQLANAFLLLGELGAVKGFLLDQALDGLCCNGELRRRRHDRYVFVCGGVRKGRW